MWNLITENGHERTMRKPNKRLRLRVHLSGVLIENICYDFEGNVRHFPLSDMLELFNMSLSTFTLLNVATCLAILNVGYSVSQENKEKSDGFFEAIVIRHKILRPIVSR